MANRSVDMTRGSVFRHVIIFTFPLLVGNLFQQFYNLVDSLVVGNFVGANALAAVGTCGSLNYLIFALSSGLSVGLGILAAQAFGAKNTGDIRRIVAGGIYILGGAGLLVSLVGYALAPGLLRLLRAPDSVLPDATVYLRLLCLGTVPVALYNGIASILRAMGDSRTPVYSLAAACIVNIIMDIVLVVYGRMGVAGAALATVLSQVISAGMLLVVLLRQRDFPLRFGELCLDGKLLKRILLIGIPAGLQFVTFDLSNTLIQSGINSFGSVVMAAWTAYGKTDAFVWMISGAFGVAITTFVGQNFGAQRYDRVRQSVRVCLVMSLGTVGVITLLMLLFRRTILGIYSADTGVIESGAYIMSIIVPFEAVFMPVEIFAGTFRGVGDSVKPTVITCLCVCVVRVVWLMTAVKLHHTLFMLCVCYPMTWILTATVFAAVYLKGDWLRKRIPEEGL